MPSELPLTCETALIARINEAFEAGDQRATSELFVQLGQPHMLCRVLTNIRRTPSYLETIAKLSYRHALGFEKILLTALPDHVGQLRMHIWWPELPRSVEHIHNHRFDFASTVIVGRLTQNTYSSEESGNRVVEFHETSSPSDQGWRFERIGAVSVTVNSTDEMVAGKAYYLSADTLHRVHPAQRTLTVTLFHQLPPRSHHSRVLAAATEVSPPRQHRFSAAELVNRLDRLVGLLSK